MAPDFATGLGARGAAPALLCSDGRSLSYAALEAAVAARAARLPGPGGLVAIAATPTPETVVAYLAALRAGCAVAMLDPDDAAGLAGFRARFDPDLCLGPDGARDGPPVPAPERPVHPDLALLLMTSGSTGQARAVRLSSTAVAANAAAIADYLGLTPQDRGALILPLCYSYGLSVLNSHLAAGASLLLDAGPVLDPDFIARLRATRCTGLAGVPYSFELLEGIDFRAAALPDLRCLTVAGGRMAPDLVRTYAAHMAARGGRFFAMYGQTEATARIAYLPPELASTAPGSIGRAVPGGALSLVDARGRPVTGTGIEGELVYRGPNVMMGYAGTRADLARGPGPAELRTGDLAVREADGLFRITGRLRRISKIGGRRIGHAELEAALVAEGLSAAVTGDDARLLAAVVAPPGRTAALRTRLATAAALPESRVEVRCVEAMPRLASGKPDLEAVRALLREPPTPRGPEGATGALAAFREVFFPRPVRAEDSFVGLAGDSLRHLELSLLLEERLGSLPAGWERLPAGRLGQAVPPRPGLRPELRTNPRRPVSPDILIRAAAITLVVVQHATLWPVPVGSAAMMVLVGFGLARFQGAALAAGDLRPLGRMLAMVLGPYALVVAGYALAWGRVPWASVFLVGNLGFAEPERHEMLPYLYWFVEAYAQTLALVAGAFLLPPVRRLARAAPFRLALTFLAVAVAARFTLPHLWPIGGRQIFTLPWVLHLAAFGWGAAVAETPRQRAILLGAAVVVMPLVALDGGNWTGSWIRYGTQVAVIAALLHAPPLPLPRLSAAAVLTVAAGGYHIYLTHRFLPELILPGLAHIVPPGIFALVAVVGGIALGLAAHRLHQLARQARASGLPPRRRAPDLEMP